MHLSESKKGTRRYNTMNFIKKNLAFTLTTSNLVLFALVILIQDPFNIFTKTYSKAKPFFQADKNLITKMVVTKMDEADKSFSLLNEGGVWSLTLKTSTVQLPVEIEKVNALIQSLYNARRFTIVTNSVDKRKDYGFDSDEIRVEVFAKDKVTFGTMYVGSVAPRGSFTHVRFEDEKEIYSVEENLKTSLGRGKFDHFIDKKFTPTGISSAEIQEVTVKNEKQEPVYSLKKNGEEWKQVEPKEVVLGKEELSPLLNSLSTLAGDDIKLEPSYKEKLDTKFSYTLTYSFTDKKGVSQPVTVLILGKHKEDNLYYASKTEGIVFTMNEYKLKTILEYKPK
jgi:hypothetical protein